MSRDHPCPPIGTAVPNGAVAAAVLLSSRRLAFRQTADKASSALFHVGGLKLQGPHRFVLDAVRSQTVEHSTTQSALPERVA